MDGFIYRIGSIGPNLGRPPSFYPSDIIRQKGCTFASVYAVRKEDAFAIQQTAGTAAGFKGIVWSQRLWIDFDNEEGPKDARKLLKELGYDYVEYTTGGRGSHFGIARTCSPSHILPLCDKHWVAENMPTADLSLYWHLHLIRLPGTIHERTGKRKALVAKVPGKSLVLPLLPESIKSRELKSDRTARKSIFSSWQVVSHLSGGGGVGDRHRHLINLAISLRRDCGVSFDEAMWVVAEVNRGFDDPKSDEELEKLVKWVYEKD